MLTTAARDARAERFSWLEKNEHGSQVADPEIVLEVLASFVTRGDALLQPFRHEVADSALYRRVVDEREGRVTSAGRDYLEQVAEILEPDVGDLLFFYYDTVVGGLPARLRGFLSDVVERGVTHIAALWGVYAAESGRSVEMSETLITYRAAEAFRCWHESLPDIRESVDGEVGS